MTGRCHEEFCIGLTQQKEVTRNLVDWQRSQNGSIKDIRTSVSKLHLTLITTLFTMVVAMLLTGIDLVFRFGPAVYDHFVPK